MEAAMPTSENRATGSKSIRVKEYQLKDESKEDSSVKLHN